MTARRIEKTAVGRKSLTPWHQDFGASIFGRGLTTIRQSSVFLSKVKKAYCVRSSRSFLLQFTFHVQCSTVQSNAGVPTETRNPNRQRLMSWGMNNVSLLLVTSICPFLSRCLTFNLCDSKQISNSPPGIGGQLRTQLRFICLCSKSKPG